MWTSTGRVIPMCAILPIDFRLNIPTCARADPAFDELLGP